MNATGKTIIRGGRLLDAPAHAAPRADILVDGDNIAEIGRPGLAAPGDATVVDALRERSSDPSEIVREHVQWALSQHADC